MADNKTASPYYDATSVAGPQSPTYIPPVEKFYWVRYTLPSGHPATKCILQHPFYFIHNYNMSEEIKRWAKVMLLDWKEITKEEILPATNAPKKKAKSKRELRRRIEIISLLRVVCSLVSRCNTDTRATNT